MRKLIIVASIFSACLIFAADEQNMILKMLDSYQSQITNLSLQTEKFSAEKTNLILSGRKAPYAILYEHTGLYEWQLFPQCYYKDNIDTINSVINVNVEYKPIDDYFPTIPAFFMLNTKRPYDLESYKTLMITVFKAIGKNIIVLYDEASSKYGYPGHHYCQSFTYSSTRMVLDSYFLAVGDIACVVYYITGNLFYGNIFYQTFFDLILNVLKFRGSTDAISQPVYSPVSFELSQNFPNPFNSNTIITYSIAKPSQIRLEIYDCTGRKAKTLFDKYHDVGDYSIALDASGLPSGLYMYRLSNDEGNKSHQMLLIK